MYTKEKVYLMRRSNGYYYIGYFEQDHLYWKSTRCKVKFQAHQYLIHFKEFITKRLNTITISEFIIEFEKTKQNQLNHKTIALYKAVLKKLITMFGDVGLNKILIKEAEQYQSNRLQTVSATTTNIELRTLKASFNAALRWNYILKNPFKEINLCRVEEVEPTYFTKEDFYTLLAIIKAEWLKDIVLFAVLTGMRRAEILNLKWNNVNLEAETILIQSNANFKTKHGKKRIIPINSIALELLKKYYLKKSNSDYIFNLKGNQIKCDWVTHYFKKAVKKANLNEKLHFHSLRHTFASWLVASGTSIYEVQKLLGHSNIKVTEVYSHLQPNTLKTTVNKLEILLN